ncbi:hypothetical protein TQ36_35785 (plasmid) [Burkholderia cenocepacia]|nr:hypothetical protein TQ36_35785 [Burkholderia cenocepacia]
MKQSLSHRETEHLASIDRHTQRHFALEHLHRMSCARISDDLASTVLNCTEVRPTVITRDPEAIAVKSIAVGDRKMEDNRARFFGHANSESLLRREKLLGVCGASEDTVQDPCKQCQRHGHDETA